MSESSLPARPSLEQLRKRAKDLLRAARSDDASALQRLQSGGARHHPPRLADAQHVIASEHGFASWPDLVHHVDDVTNAPNALASRPMIRPDALEGSRPYALVDGSVVTTQEVWHMFVATRDGDRGAVRALVEQAPALAVVEYNYTPPIHFAVREGHVDLVEFLLDRGADIASYKTYAFGDSLLMMAEDREQHAVAALLRERLSKQFRLAEGTKGIIDAARTGDIDGVRAELARDPNLARVSNDVGDTALHHAAHNGHLGIVELLLAAGADPDAVRGDGYRPIHLTLMPNFLVGVRNGVQVATADLLLARGARYTLFVAALRLDVPFIRTALQRDPSLANEEDTNHHRPLSAAARRNDLALVRLLLDHGANPNLPEEGAPRGHALWVAVHDRRHEMVRLLLEHGADPNGMVESSGTPMMMAERDQELFELLRQFGGKAERNEPDELAHLISKRRFADIERMLRDRPELIRNKGLSWWQGVLAGPARDGDHDLIAMLMRLGARVPPVSEWAPFYYFKHEATAAFLLQHGMGPDHMNWQRVTLLHYMAAEGEMGKARLLLDHGANIDAIDDEYRSTPLGLAARRGQREMVSLLLERGADPGLAAAPWATPLAWASKRGYSDVIARLTAAGAS